MIESSKAVFLSYASQDAETARRICEALRSAGIEVWLDQSQLRGGDAWDRQIRKQIHDCGLFIPIISSNTQARLEGYFRLEWKLAVERTHLMSDRVAFLVPIVIDEVRERDADVPEAFRAVQWTRLPAGSTPPSFAERLSRLLAPGQLQSSATEHPSQLSSNPPIRHRSAPWRRGSVLLLLASLALIGVGYFAVDRFMSSQHALPSASITQPLPASGALPEKSIAVLPFVDMSEKKDQEYFSDGLAEELIDHLTRSADLKVIARTSSFQFKGKNEDVRTIATKLGVANLLEGSVRTAGHEMRVTVQLIRASDGTHLWSQTYDRMVSDIFKVQEDIASQVAQALKATLAGHPVPAWGSEQNPEALRSLLKGDFFYYRNNEGDYDRAIDQYQQALAADPKYALAWARLGRVYIIRAQTGNLNGSEAHAKARDALRWAIALDAHSVPGHRWLGRLYAQFDYDFPAAEKQFKQAIALDSGGQEGRKAQEDLLTFSAFRNGQFDPIIALIQQDLELNPLDATAQWYLGGMQYYAGRFKESLVTRRRVIELSPAYSGAQADAALSLVQLGNVTEAVDTALKETDEPSRLATASCAYFAGRRLVDSDIAVRQLESKYADVSPYLLALARACRQEADATFKSLGKAYQHRAPAMVGLKFEPLFESLRSDTRFKALMRKVNFPE